MTNQLPDPDLIEQYTKGECHIFAAASVILHGGSFLVAYDSDKVHWRTRDEAVFEVLHVFAVHDTADGQVIRDIHGDRMAEPDDALQAELSEAHCIWAGDIYLEWMTAAELLTLICDPDGRLGAALQAEPEGVIMDHDVRPLIEATERDLSVALGLEETQAAPGSRPAPALDEAMTPEM